MHKHHHLTPVALLLLYLAALPLGGCSGKSGPRTVAIAFSNNMIGEIRSCGCALTDYGGLGRRATFLAQARDTTSGDFLLLEGGDFFSDEINYGREKAELTLKSMAYMEYDAIAVGEKDLGLGLDFLTDNARKLNLPILACNMMAGDTLIFPPTRVVTLESGLRVGLIGVMSQQIDLPQAVTQYGVKVTDPFAAVRKHAALLRKDVDLVAVVGHLLVREATRMARQLGEIDIIALGHEARPFREMKRTGGAFLLQLPERGRYMGIAFAVLGEDLRIRSLSTEISPLTESYADNEAIDMLFRAYDMNISRKEQVAVPSALVELRKTLKDPYVGAQACAECHSEVYEHWATTKHAHAFDILTDRSREYDRDCTPCHTTGFADRGGFYSFAITPELANVQCEACHGNGHAHVADPEVAPSKVATQACVKCHTEEQSPGFNFDERWELIRH